MVMDLIFIHGALGDGSQLRDFAELFRDRFRVHLLNLYGHGLSDVDTAFSMRGFVDQVNRYMEGCGMASANFFGYSMGGYVALRLASEDQSKVSGIVTLGTKLKWSPEIADKETAMLDADRIMDKVPEFGQRLKALHSGLGWERVLQGTADLMRGLGESPFEKREFESVHSKVLLLRGSKDRMVSAEETKEAADWIPGARYMELENVPHPFEMVDLKLLYPVVSDFLASVE